MIKCTKCGKELPDDSDFCSICGLRLVKPVTKSVFELPKSEPATESKRRFPKKALIGGIAAACAVVIAIVTYLNVPKGEYVTTDPSSTTQHTKEEVSEVIKSYDKYLPSHVVAYEPIDVEYNLKAGSPEETFFNNNYNPNIPNYVYFLDGEFSNFVVYTEKMAWVDSGNFNELNFRGALYIEKILQEHSAEYDFHRQVLSVCYDANGDISYALTAEGWLFDMDGNYLTTIPYEGIKE